MQACNESRSRACVIPHATLLLELGEHPKVVQERLGHSTITTTMNIYSHVTPTMQKAAADRFAAHLGGA